MSTQDIFKQGDVIEDSYGNPAVVLSTRGGRPDRIMQVAGSDRGRIANPPLDIVRVTGKRADWALEIARKEWKRQGLRRSDFVCD